MTSGSVPTRFTTRSGRRIAGREIKELGASSAALIDGGSKQAMEVSTTAAEVKHGALSR